MVDIFQIDLLKDQVEEVEEQSSLILKELRAKTHDYELLKRDHAESQRAVQLLQAAMEAQQNMLQERGLVLLGGEEEEEEEEVGEDEQEKRTRAIVSQDTANILAGLGKYQNFHTACLFHASSAPLYTVYKVTIHVCLSVF